MDEPGVTFFGQPRKRRKLGKGDPRDSTPHEQQKHDNGVRNGGTEDEPIPSPNSQSAPHRPSSFKELGLSDWLSSVCSTLRMNVPTDVQASCIPRILEGRDIIGIAHTGSGKTAAFALPILQRLAQDPYGVYALVLTPTRELAFQLTDHFKALGAGMSLRTLTVIGGVDMQSQSQSLNRRPHVVIATPGRLSSLLTLDPSLQQGFRRVQFLVLDEADRMLDPTFEADLRVVLSCLPTERQTLLFSATMTQGLVKLQQSGLRDAHVFQAYEGLHTANKLREQYVFVPAKVKEVYLYQLLADREELKVRSAIIFVSTCRGCHLLGHLMEELDIPCAVLHSGRSQKHRLAALNKFKSEVVPLLLATDVGSRGLDIPTVDLVINFDLPVAARDYVHRVGRTARAGRGGWALSFVSQYDVELVHKIESMVGHQLEAYPMEEAKVMKCITRVFNAKKTAMLRAVQEEEKGTLRRKKKKDN